MHVPGFEHVCHNVVRHVSDKLGGYHDSRTKLHEHAEVLTNGFYIDRLCNTCLVGPHLESVRELVRGKIRMPKGHRFLSVVLTLADMLPLEWAMLNYFDSQEMFGVVTNEKDSWIDKKLVGQSMVDVGWWAYAKMLVSLFMGPHHIVFMSRSCRCHSTIVVEALHWVCGLL
jgi:hypothetical protein